MWPPGSYPRYGAMAPEEPPATRLRGLRGWAGAQGSGFGVQVEGPSLFPQKAPLGFPIQVPLPEDCYAMEAETRNMKPEEFAACAGLVGCSSLDMACGIAFRLSQMAWHGAGFQSSQPDDVIKKGDGAYRAAKSDFRRTGPISVQRVQMLGGKGCTSKAVELLYL
eukprot:s2327_g2.t1